MRYYLLTLGCPKNSVDSEGMAMLLGQAGYGGTADPDEADVLLVNTCGFLAAAEDESLAALRELAGSKRRGQLLIAAGCMAQRNGERIVREVPGIDGLLGTRRWMEIVPFIQGLRGGTAQRAPRPLRPAGRPGAATRRPGAAAGRGRRQRLPEDQRRLQRALRLLLHPQFQGQTAQPAAPAIVAEARALVAQGAHELILIAQDTTDYGRDLGTPDALPDLMQAILDAAPDLRWLRLMYAYPGHVSPRLIEVMAGDPRICHYLDIPLQHGDPGVLRRMFRPSNVEHVLETIGAMRAAMPDMAFRSTFITGLPGETEQASSPTCSGSSRRSSSTRSAFSPSARNRAHPRGAWPEQVPEKTKARRRERLMAAQQRISLARNQAQVGRVSGCPRRKPRRVERPQGSGLAGPQLPGCSRGGRPGGRPGRVADRPVDARADHRRARVRPGGGNGQRRSDRADRLRAKSGIPQRDQATSARCLIFMPDYSTTRY